MNSRSGKPSVDSFRHSSSFPHRSPYAFPVVEPAGPSQASARRSELSLDESARAYRTTALRQLNGNSKPFARKNQQNNQTGARSSTLASQPVLVRSYSGRTDDTAENSKMSSRRPFPFTGSSKDRNRGPELPSAEDFSIEGILRVIEPDIRNTLDTIAEICGRSKLSLANEYGSHIAPLGEIRAPPGGLVTVEEASPSRERQGDDNVVIYDDDNSFACGRDHQLPYPYYSYFSASQIGHNSGYQSTRGDGPSARSQPGAPGMLVDLNYGTYPFPISREFPSKPSSCCRAFLGKTPESGPDNHSQDILTPAVVSEIYIAAQASNTSSSSGPEIPSTGGFAADPTEHYDMPPGKQSILPDLQTLLSWFKYISLGSRSGSSEWQAAETGLRETPERQTAVVRLRQVLERQASWNISQAACG
ncbi:hypothetical protein PHISCL_08494 [Aspergillus sclerotialis]|uniref:Uncharacterized protein n=1 Tax=Aspergillus sclerotialis TaxID=2070753 RepID=A0A3A2Z7V9_9EURO|nr:hypothetical protein PHISCL_08494 [Aspergillus sclerotialis]